MCYIWFGQLLLCNVKCMLSIGFFGIRILGNLILSGVLPRTFAGEGYDVLADASVVIAKSLKRYLT